MSEPVYEYMREGCWTTSHGTYYRFAYEAFADFAQALKEVEQREDDMRNRKPLYDEPLLSAVISHETWDLETTAYRHAESCLIFLCMTIESFLNHYGVKRLGYEFYKKYIERLGITEKIAVLCLSCLNIKLDSNDPLITKTRALFDRRNQLVHPKTREIVPGKLKDFVTLHPRNLDLKRDLDDLEMLIDRLCSLDPSITRDSEFRKPSKGIVGDDH